MHYTSHLLIMLLVNYSVVSAQSNQLFYRVNFKVDESALDQADKLVLDQLYSDYKKGTYGEIQITAHTDADAGDGYNMELSHKRAESVVQYLTLSGIRSNRVSVKWFGERKPEQNNSNTDGKAANRRVDITLKQYSFSNSGDVIQAAAPVYKQTYTIDPSKDNTVKGNNGTLITIPKNSLVTMDGKPVTATNIEVVLEEYLTPKDAAFNQLSTVSDGRMLESGGMFSVKAFVQNEEVQLIKGKQMKVEMPTINMKPGMELFAAVKNANGVTEWKNTSVPFTPKAPKQEPVIFTQMDTRYLRSLMVNQSDFDAGTLELSYDLPEVPKVPQKPKDIPRFVTPTKKSMFTWYERAFIPGFILNKKVKEEYERREKMYTQKLARYSKQYARYEEAYTQYLNDSTAFEQASLTRMQNWMRTQQSAYKAYVRHLEIRQWNSALAEFVNRSEQHSLTFKNPEIVFMSYLNANQQVSSERDKFIQAIYRIDFLLTVSMTTIVQHHAPGGVLIPTSDLTNFNVNFVFKNTFAEQQLAGNSGLKKALRAAQQDIQQQREKAGLSEPNPAPVTPTYTTTLSGFGAFNCDRFRNIPEYQMATLTIPYPAEAQVAFYVAGTNSYLIAARSATGYSATLPKGLPVKVVLVALHPEKGPMVAIQQTVISDHTSLSIDPRNVTLDELQQEIASL